MKQINLCGAKNSALPLLAATILARNLYYFRNIPRISDVHVQIKLYIYKYAYVWIKQSFT